MRLVVTRPEPEASRTAALLRDRGHTVDVTPLLHVELIADADLGAGPWSGVVITSANALRAIEDHPRKAELLASFWRCRCSRSAAAVPPGGICRFSQTSCLPRATPPTSRA
jgi:uroporphyrinogen-III synthase